MKAVVGLAVVLLLGLTWLVMQGCDAEERGVQRAQRVLDEIAAAESALYRDVLRARAGLLRNYDPLVQTVVRLRAGAAELADRTRATGERAAAATLVQIVDAQETLVERFKSDNALLQNSLTSFGLLGARLATPQQVPEVVRAVSGLSTAMLHVTLDSDAAVGELETRLRELAATPFPAAVAPQMAALTKHAELLASLLPAADGAVRALHAAGHEEVSARLRRLLAARGDAAEIAGGRARLVLYATSTLLAILAVYLARGLQNYARSLRRRAELEHVIARNSTRLINSRASETADRVRQALAELVECLGVERGYLVLRGISPTVVHRDAGAAGDLAADWPDRALDLAAMLPEMADGVVNLAVPRAATARTPLEAALAGRGLDGWICVPGSDGSRVDGLLAFDVVGWPPRFPAGEVGSLRMAFNAMANALTRDGLEAERTRLERNLQHTSRIETVGALASGVAHNFNNIVGAILGFAEMARAETGPETPVAGHVREISRAAERARDLVGQILTLGRRGSTRQDVVPVATLLEETKSLLDAALPAEIALLVEDATAGAAVPGDLLQLQQVLMNLCGNAAEAMDHRGTVRLLAGLRSLSEPLPLASGTIDRGDFVVIAVADAGRGMDGQTAVRAFEPFFTTRKAGTGLGLATARAIALDHGGGIGIDSVPGRGTRIEVWLPAGSEPATCIRGAGQAILVLEADRQRLLRNEELVAALGYEPVGFIAADDALRACRREPDRFDAALLCRIEAMPMMFRRATDLRAAAPHMPMLATTHWSQRWEADQLAGAGIAGVLSDPIASADLARTLDRCLAKARGAGPGLPGKTRSLTIPGFSPVG